jgi:hypothetical protein
MAVAWSGIGRVAFWIGFEAFWIGFLEQSQYAETHTRVLVQPQDPICHDAANNHYYDFDGLQLTCLGFCGQWNVAVLISDQSPGRLNSTWCRGVDCDLHLLNPILPNRGNT